MNYDISILNEYLKDFDLKLDNEQLSKFYDYYKLLIEWNEKINLTAITDFQDVIIKHFVDSLSIVKCKNNKYIDKILNGESVSMIDIGTGAGFPSIPLKIAFPNIKITMLDSLNKRIKFLDIVISELALNNIEALHGRAEDFASAGKMRELFDISVSRAVANLSTLSEYCLPYVKVDGIFISYKSEVLKDELLLAKNAIRILGAEVEEIYDFNLPSTDFFRSLCLIKKIKATSKKYPRKAGLPSKEPLK